jgi:hypothetical protein
MNRSAMQCCEDLICTYIQRTNHIRQKLSEEEEDYPGRSKRDRLRSENGPYMLSKRRLYDRIPCKHEPFSVRIYPYGWAQKYVPYFIRIVNGPYVAVFPAFTDKVRPSVLQRIITVNYRKRIVLDLFRSFL